MAEMKGNGMLVEADGTPLVDAREWAILFQLAELEDGEEPRGCFAALHGVRCLGAPLGNTGGHGRITPGPDYGGDLYSGADWEEDRQEWLLPHRATIARLLAGLKPPVVPERPAR